jgi:predicted dehydrogenase
MSADKRHVILVGSGVTAVEHAKAIHGLGYSCTVVGRSGRNADAFAQFGFSVHSGGLLSFFASTKLDLTKCAAVVCTTIGSLAGCAMQLLDAGVRDILLEKPGCLYLHDLLDIQRHATDGQNVYIAYNRRFYASVYELERIVQADGGVTSYAFDFTERGDVLVTIPGTENHHFMSMSTHLVDLAYFLGGFPAASSFTSVARAADKCLLHGTVTFAGHGLSTEGAPFTFHANHAAAGRWMLDVCTAQHRLRLCPLEKVQIQPPTSYVMSDHAFDNSIDVQYKPGFYKQMAAFLDGADASRMLSLAGQVEHFQNVYMRMLIGTEPRRVLFLGYGQMGHFKLLSMKALVKYCPVQIVVVEPYAPNGQRAKDTAAEMKLAGCEVYASVDEVPEGSFFDLIVDSMTANARESVYTRIVEKGVRFQTMMCEKLLYHEDKPNTSVYSSLSKQRSVFVFMPWRTGPVFRYIRSYVTGPVKARFWGGQWGFASNCVHLVDCFASLIENGTANLTCNSFEVDKVFAQKRPGFHELTGRATFSSGESCLELISTYDLAEGESILQFEIGCDLFTCHGDLSTGKAVVKMAGHADRTFSPVVPYASSQFGELSVDALSMGACVLPTLQQALDVHAVVVPAMRAAVREKTSDHVVFT